MANAIYDPEEEALLRRAHEYATGQVPYDNEEDLLNQAQSYSQNPRYWNQAGAAPMAYDPTLEPADAYPGAVPQNQFTQSVPEETGSYDGMDDLGGYANEEPIGGTGYEQAYSPNRPGFFYTSSVAGEAGARQRWNDRPGVDAPLDYSGNAYAHKAALKYDQLKAQADAQREIEAAYEDSRSRNHLEAIRAAEDHLKERGRARAISEGVEPWQAVAMYGMGSHSSGMGSTINALRGPGVPAITQLPGGQEAVTYGRNLKILAPPATAGAQSAPTAFTVMDQDGNEVKGIKAMPNANGKGFVYVRERPDVPIKDVQATVEIPGRNPLQPGTKYSGGVSRMREMFAGNANAPAELRGAPAASGPAPAAPVQEVLRKVGNRVAVFDANTKRFIRYANANE